MDETAQHLDSRARELSNKINEMSGPGEEEVSLLELSKVISKKSLKNKVIEKECIDTINEILRNDLGQPKAVIAYIYDYITDNLLMVFNTYPKTKVRIFKNNEGKLIIDNPHGRFRTEVFEAVKPELEKFFDQAQVVKDLKMMHENFKSSEGTFDISIDENNFLLKADNLLFILGNHEKPNKAKMYSDFPLFNDGEMRQVVNNISFSRDVVPEFLHDDLEEELKYRGKNKVYKKILSIFK